MVVEVAEVVVPGKREFAERPGQHVTFVPGDARVQVVRNRELPELVLLGDEPVALVVGDPLGPIVPAVFAVLGKSPKNSKSRSIGGRDRCADAGCLPVPRRGAWLVSSQPGDRTEAPNTPTRSTARR